jgi:hypothetical protein
MSKFGALTPHQIEALLAGEPRERVLAYLAECTRLMTALAPFARPELGPLVWVPRRDHVAHKMAQNLSDLHRLKTTKKRCKCA